MKNKLVGFLNKTIKCTIKPSPIGGVGIFAIRDIKQGELLTEYTYDTLNLRKGFITLTREDFALLNTAIQNIILDRVLFVKGEELTFLNPNHDAYLKTFMNHSHTPNSDGDVAIIGIKEGEEITFDYNNNHLELDELTKQHMAFLNKTK